MKELPEKKELKKYLKSKILLTGFIFLVFLSSSMILYTQIPRANASAQINYANYNYINVAGTDVNATITTNVGILTDGGISLWSIVPTIITNLSVQNVIVRGTRNGSTFNRGITFQTTAELEADTILTVPPIPSPNLIYSDYPPSMKENLLLIPNLYGIPNSFSFNISVYIATATNNMTFYLSSGNNPLTTIIFRNPEATTEIGSLFFILMYLLPFLLPISIIVIYIVSKKIADKKVKEQGGQKNEA